METVLGVLEVSPIPKPTISHSLVQIPYTCNVTYVYMYILRLHVPYIHVNNNLREGRMDRGRERGERGREGERRGKGGREWEDREKESN